MSTELLHLLAALAVWRVTSMIVREEGPFAVFSTIRWYIDRHERTWIGRGLNCTWCMSFWVGIVTTVYMYFMGWTYLELTPIVALALSSFAIVIDTAVIYLTEWIKKLKG